MGKIAFVFAGQGAQYPGMGRGALRGFSRRPRNLRRGGGAPPGHPGAVLFGHKEELSRTINTQPCLFAMDLACAAALAEAGVHAAGAAGFSLGEIAAVAYCGLLSVQDAFRLVCRRAELMSRCSQEHPGAMSAILKLSEEQVRSLCEKYSGVFPVNFNCPGQTVVSGEEGHLAQLEQDVAAAKGRAMRLKVSGCFHTPHMENASEGLREFMSRPGFWPARSSPLCQCNCRSLYFRECGGTFIPAGKEPRFMAENHRSDAAKRRYGICGSGSGKNAHRLYAQNNQKRPGLQCGIARNAAGGSISIERRKPWQIKWRLSPGHLEALARQLP